MNFNFTAYTIEQCDIKFTAKMFPESGEGRLYVKVHKFISEQVKLDLSEGRKDHFYFWFAYPAHLMLV